MHTAPPQNPMNNRKHSATQPTMRLSRNPGTPRKQERRKERTTDHATQILVFALSYCTISLPSHGYFNPEGLGCRSAKVFLCLRVVVVFGGGGVGCKIDLLFATQGHKRTFTYLSWMAEKASEDPHRITPSSVFVCLFYYFWLGENKFLECQYYGFLNLLRCFLRIRLYPSIQVSFLKKIIV